MGARIGIDVGGTFTDFLLINPDGSRLVHKTSSIPSDPARAVTQGLREIAETQGLAIEEFLAGVDTIVHGTTVATNALLTRRGNRTGLLTTEGFRDVLALRDGTREEAYDNRLLPPTPIVERRDTLAVPGRVTSAGEEVTALSEDAVRAAGQLFHERGITSIAISFMHSYANEEHEVRAEQILAQEIPGAYITRSSELLAQARYYDRTSTSVLNSYVGPIIRDYIGVLTATLEEVSFKGILLIMQSNGGVTTPEGLTARAALSLLSGPASAPTAGLLEVAPHGWDRCLTVDMGGTSFDAAIVDGGRPLVKTDGTIDRWRIALPMVDIHTIGAGGGSIASVDEGGMLRVGPQSAGAVPGPISYRRGGIQPTTTDADVVLGYIAPTSFLGGEMTLDVDAARKAIAQQIGEPLGLDPTEAAAGIYEVVNVSMAAGVREITVRRGLDPRDFPIVVAGGAGPVHAAAIARELEIPLLVVPRESSIFCAAGMLVCDFRHDYVQSQQWNLSSMQTSEVTGIWASMAEQGRTTLMDEGVSTDRISFLPSLDMRYRGQWFEINVPLDESSLDSLDIAAAADKFHQIHNEQFGYHTEDTDIEVLNVRLTATGLVEGSTQPSEREGGTALDAHLGRREIWSPLHRRMVEADIYSGSSMGPGAEIQGPAIIELGTTSIVVLDEYDAVVDVSGSFVLYLRERASEMRERIQTGSTPVHV
ncbi:hydantoinase/oxoprolinase family protein [Arthrobacter sp. CAU 1506]|uniref:hydantoinase/oxoprolinase family protein n=1 Tax=Arthrobacter sp. CAU 1506 TaxID=2560052 RepID=UPI0010AD6822|nr:hydantoinase/oxoprolinase family protein [Arthrobacter sp. CAU 1506]TJY64094.1 hydantoinase/oxoprolinase family protein [Arthrobacter sp. CAU 1506]